MKAPSSYIFSSVVRLLFFLINLVALYLLLRGHDEPGGGFIAGLATAISLILLSLGLGLRAMHEVVRVDPARLALSGLALSTLSAAVPLLWGGAFLEHSMGHWEDVPLLGAVHVGTPLVFDIGVYLVVVGSTVKMLFVLAQSTQRMTALVEHEERRYHGRLEQPIEDE